MESERIVMHCRAGRGGLVCVSLILILGARPALQSPSSGAELPAAAAAGDIAAVKALLARGGDVNAANDRGVTALYTAADRANLAVVKLLLDHGADPNKSDLEWGKTPLHVAAVPWTDVKAERERAEIIRLLLEKGAGTGGEALVDLIRGGFFDAARTIVSRGGALPSYLNQALAAARRAKQAGLVEELARAGAKEPGPMDDARTPERLKLVAGVYRSQSGRELTLRPGVREDELVLERTGRPRVAVTPADLTLIRSHDMKVAVRLKGGALPPTQLTLYDGGAADVFTRAADLAPAAGAPAAGAGAGRSAAAPTFAPVTRPVGNWPSFRGPSASGIADGAHLPTSWDVEQSINIRWKTPIPGLAHSSPIIWGDRVFVTTAVPSGDTMVFRHGAAVQGAGATASAKDEAHSWRVYALDKHSGKVLWERVAREGVPRTQRHVMQSQADPTPATDGTHLVVSFGSEGLYCYDLNGKLLWKRDLGPLSSGFVVDPSYEWTLASSPIIYKDLVILQADLLKDSFIAAFDIRTGKDVWRTKRDEVPSWGTPLVYEGPPRTELVTVATNFARAYDPATGKELWRLGNQSSFSTPTPVAGSGLIFLTSGSGGTVQPIYAIRPGGSGDITLKEDEVSSEYVVWSRYRGGSFTPTPVVYEDLLYVCGSNGVLAAYKAATGERVYQQRLAPGGYSASGVAADGKLYFASEEGDVVVVKAGPTFEKLAQNRMGEVIMASPAISTGMMFFRTQHHLVAVGESPQTRRRLW